MTSRRKLAAAVAGLALATAAVLTGGPAYAAHTSSACKSYVGGRTICVSSYWINQVGSTGVTIISIEVAIGWNGDNARDYWNATALDCDAVRIWTEPDDTVRWRRDGTDCDVSAVATKRGWDWLPDGRAFNNAPEVDVSWAGWPKFRLDSDPGRQVVTLHLVS